jgi:aspartate/methionine/tyrosine aminotransferase
VDGTPALKAAIISKFKRENALDYTATEVMSVVGKKFQLESNFSPMGDQPQAIKTLVDGVNAGEKLWVYISTLE